MSQFTYTRATIKTRVNAGLKGKLAVVISQEDLINQAVRDIYTLMDIRSARRRSTISPGLFADVRSYPAPVDLNGVKITDIAPQINRSRNSDFFLVTPEEFSRRKDPRSFAVDDRDEVVKILINTPSDFTDTHLTVSNLDSTTAGGGTWVASGGATNITKNILNYVDGSASLSYDLDATTSATAGIKNTTLTAFDITKYTASSVFCYAYLVSTTGVNSFTLKIGTDTSNYYTQTVTTTHESLAFQAGWNLLRFDFPSMTQTGTVTVTNCRYAEIYMNKDTTKKSVTGYLFDKLVLRQGQVYNVTYYTSYPWVNIAGAYIPDSTADTDIILADPSELNMIIYKAIELGAAEMDEDMIEKKAQGRLKLAMDDYTIDNPSDAKLMTTTYYDFISN